MWWRARVGGVVLWLAAATACSNGDGAAAPATCDAAAARLHRLRADHTALMLGQRPGFADDAPGASAWRASELARISRDCRGAGSGSAWSAAKARCVVDAATWEALAACDVGVRSAPQDARPSSSDARRAAPPDAGRPDAAPPDAAPPPPSTIAEAERLVDAYCACPDDACRRPLSAQLRGWQRGLTGAEASDDDVRAIKRRNRITVTLTTCMNQALGTPGDAR